MLLAGAINKQGSIILIGDDLMPCGHLLFTGTFIKNSEISSSLCN